MCGRFASYDAYPKLARRLGVVVAEEGPPARYNIPPGTWITGFRQVAHDAQPEQLELWWGYRPKWAKGKAAQPINARVETVATSGYFKYAFARARCIVPADGWFEWLVTDTGKQPHYLTRTDREPIAKAGIYAEREDGSLGCAILTEPARGTAAEVHDRMPLILDDASLEPWLDPDLTDRETIRHVVRHLDGSLFEHWPVSRAVNRPGNDEDAGLINPA
ncbi:SOS response-associated peptidase [Marinobacter sp. TBZ242]|uniref:Abasic site processing protein n=1 Tax=Marinobacter azerbaijanicus TaxID=3050455 RepID=A0ABT7II55_9GAMM|nr:SOS response-associated peptidase [Marinobacter sp. TBZ242]MDL0433871.1 SOS response-associated peptidase [Marinobacter sp. TBZ242]